jgi:hypothetical protein
MLGTGNEASTIDCEEVRSSVPQAISLRRDCERHAWPQAIVIVEMATPWAGWEGSTTGQMMSNLAKSNELPKRYQAILESAAVYANSEGTSAAPQGPRLL